MTAELVPTVYNSSEYSNDFPSTSNVRQTHHDRSKQTSEYKCEICSQRFHTMAQLNEHHQQHGCEGLIEIESNTLDCKPTVVDFTDPECHTVNKENQAIDNDSDVSEQVKHFRIIMNRMTQRPNNINKPTKSKNRINTSEQSHKKNDSTGKRSFDCQLCDKT